MERISDDDLLNIFKRVATTNVGRFLRFRATSSHHWRLAKTPEVLRALPRNCLSFLTDPKPCVGKQILTQRISDNGHPTFCVARAAQLFHETHFDLTEIKELLLGAKSHGSVEAEYFLMILDALASDGFFSRSFYRPRNPLRAQTAFRLQKSPYVGSRLLLIKAPSLRIGLLTYVSFSQNHIYLIEIK